MVFILSSTHSVVNTESFLVNKGLNYKLRYVARESNIQRNINDVSSGRLGNCSVSRNRPLLILSAYCTISITSAYKSIRNASEDLSRVLHIIYV